MNATFKRVLSWVPFLAGALDTTWPQWKEAMTQFAVVLLVSMLPPILTALIQFVRITAASRLAGYDFIRPGELLVSVTALIAPALWVMVDLQRRRKQFEDHIWFMLAVVFLIGGSSTLFVMDKINSMLDPTKSLEAGAILYLLALALWFSSLLYQARLMAPYEGRQRAEEQELEKEVADFDPRNPS